MRIRFIGRACQSEAGHCDAFGFRWPRGTWLGAPKLSPQEIALIRASPAFETDPGQSAERPEAASRARPAPPPERRESGFLAEEPDQVG